MYVVVMTDDCITVELAGELLENLLFKDKKNTYTIHAISPEYSIMNLQFNHTTYRTKKINNA